MKRESAPNNRRKCDLKKPAVCGRSCILQAKSCSFNPDSCDIDTTNQYQYIESIADSKYNEPYKTGNLKHKITNAEMTINEAVQMIRKEKHIPNTNNISISSIIFSSPMNRKIFMEFIKGSAYGRQLKFDHDIFNIHHYTKKQNLEMLW